MGWDRGLEEACSLSCSVDALFVDINYTICDYKEELLEEVLRSMEKFYRCKDIVYDILPPKIVQVYCTSDLRKYKWGKYENRKKHIKTANGIKLKNNFDLHRSFLKAIYYGQKISKKIFPLKYSLGTRKLKKGLQSDNVEAK